VVGDAGKTLFDRLLSLSLSDFQDVPREQVFLLLQNLLRFCNEEEIKEVCVWGGIKCIVEKMREKRERNGRVMEEASYALGEFFNDMGWEKVLRREMVEWKGMTEMKEMLWMVEEEGGVESATSNLHVTYAFHTKMVSRGLGVCCYHE
jgi:hypothetical protein